MKIRILWCFILLAVLLAACAPAKTQNQPTMPARETVSVNPTATPVMDLTATPATSAPSVQLVVTSRGPNLEATDPKTVSMASGGLQFVEFFEFW